jgi:hypothetical protein
LISEFPPHSIRGKRFDWDVIFDGYIRELERGIDFDCQPASLVARVREAARRRNLAVDVRSYTRPEDWRTVVAVKALDGIT